MATPSIVDFRLNLAEDLKTDWDLSQSYSAFYKLLEKHPLVKKYRDQNKHFKLWIDPLDLKERVMLLTLIALDQAEAVFTGFEKLNEPSKEAKELAQKLFKVELFYKPIGGLIGYYLVVLKLLQKKTKPILQSYVAPPMIPMEDPLVDKYVLEGLKKLPLTGEVYPVGGAGDRLNLTDPVSKEALPQAKLLFEGRNLLEGLIRDLKARENLYQEVFHEEILTPIALMTSPEKNNTRHILEILEESNWYERPRESFFLFEQPLVPVITNEGTWAAKGPFDLTMKPGGHGVIWLLMEEYQVFNWFKSKKREYLVIRQINNPLAGVDKNLLALAGYGIKEKKSFGFLSCNRLIGASEGMNILIQSKNEDGYQSTITNIEYTDFASKGIEDKPLQKGDIYSKYPANTNILFLSIKDIRKTLPSHPLPGMILNPKNRVQIMTESGLQEAHGGRLEATMQNVADYLTVTTPSSEVSLKELKTFVLFNPREKTISVTKKQFIKGDNPSETPVQAFQDKQKITRSLLAHFCNFKVSDDAVLTIDPALGPLYEIISQKIQVGLIGKNSELVIEGSQVKINNLQLNGSLKLLANKGRILIENVTVSNKGLNSRKKNLFWQNTYSHESLTIECEEDGEFEAIGITFKEPLHIHVPKKTRVVAQLVKGKIELISKKISRPTWEWQIRFNSKAKPSLTFKG